MASWREWLNNVSTSASQTFERAIAGSARQVEPVLESVKNTVQAAAQRAEWALEYADQFYNRLGGDQTEILDKCPTVKAILAHRALAGSEPEFIGRLYNVRLRPIVTAAILSAGGAGMLTFDEALSRLTRQMFDGKQLIGGWAQEQLTTLIGPEKVGAINRWMDTVPGSATVGGGWLHRIQHGHDLDAVVQIYHEYGFEGAIQAVYHIYGRDFFTPAGIPILPDGTKEAHQFLTEQLNLGPEQAADLLSLNFIELVGGALAGVFTLLFLFRIALLAKGLQENIRVRDLVTRAQQAGESQDYLSALSLAQDAISYRPRDALLIFLKAGLLHRTGNKLQAHLAFQEVSAVLARDEPMLELGGARLSLRGIAAAGALATSDALCRNEQYRSAWIDHVVALARCGITAHETVGNNLLNRRVIKRFRGPNVLPPRFLSAALNFYLAGRIAGASMYLPEREAVLARVANKLDEAIAQAEGMKQLKDRLDDIRFIRGFIGGELRDFPHISHAGLS